MNRFTRCVLALAGAVLLGLLFVALLLEPDRQGYGTHQQLGLPPCTIVVLYGRRCPSCGMTTSWAYLVRGQVGAAIEANVGGALLGLVALASAPWMLASATRGRWLWRKPAELAMIAGTAAIACATLVQWLIRWVGD